MQKLIKKDKTYGDELRKTIHDLATNNLPSYNELKRHKLKGRLSGFNDIHFSHKNNDLILIYRLKSDNTLYILEIQNTTNHNRLDSERITNNYVTYDEDEIFKESYDPEVRKRLINMYLELKDKCEALESTDYEDGYCDAMYDMMLAFNLFSYFDINK